jgi:hypothetical protein
MEEVLGGLIRKQVNKVEAEMLNALMEDCDNNMCDEALCEA